LLKEKGKKKKSEAEHVIQAPRTTKKVLRYRESLRTGEREKGRECGRRRKKKEAFGQSFEKVGKSEKRIARTRKVRQA